MDVYGEYSVMVMVMVIVIVCVWVVVLVYSPHRTSLQEVSLSSVFSLIYIGVDRYMCRVLFHGQGKGLDQVLVLVYSYL